MASLHILIATIGRPSLQTMLDSILPFLTEVDHLTVVFDGVEPTQIKTETKGSVHIHHEPIALGYWGHGIRNKYASHLEKTDFVMHGDDDDTYAPGAFDAVRSACTDVNTLYMMKVYNVTRNTYLPAFPKIENRNISTQCGVIPHELNTKGTWGPFYGGDFAFYESIEPLAPVVFVDSVIYLYNCPWH
jgi:hypothetical protein